MSHLKVLALGMLVSAMVPNKVWAMGKKPYSVKATGFASGEGHADMANGDNSSLLAWIWVVDGRAKESLLNSEESQERECAETDQSIYDWHPSHINIDASKDSYCVMTVQISYRCDCPLLLGGGRNLTAHSVSPLRHRGVTFAYSEPLRTYSDYSDINPDPDDVEGTACAAAFEDAEDGAKEVAQDYCNYICWPLSGTISGDPYFYPTVTNKHGWSTISTDVTIKSEGTCD